MLLYKNIKQSVLKQKKTKLKYWGELKTELFN